MNHPAVDFYRSKGVDLEHEMLEIAVCAQHNNGGFTVDHWWRTNIKGIYAIGEAAGTHGVYRPGGSALNAGQVGALRAARHIAAQPCAPVPETLRPGCQEQLQNCLDMIASLQAGSNNTAALASQYRRRMSASGAAFRSPQELKALAEDTRRRSDRFLSSGRRRFHNSRSRQRLSSV